MKKSTFILLLSVLLFSCQKNNLNDQPVMLAGHVKSIQVISPIQTLYTYDNSEVKVLETKISEKEYKLEVKLKEKEIVIEVKIKEVEKGGKEYKLESPEGKEYYSFKESSEHQVGFFEIKNEIPFSELSGEQHRGVAESFAKCMNRMFAACSESWICTLMCGSANIAACTLGFAVGCASGVY